jgi:hypothetical protein
VKIMTAACALDRSLGKSVKADSTHLRQKHGAPRPVTRAPRNKRKGKQAQTINMGSSKAHIGSSTAMRCMSCSRSQTRPTPHCGRPMFGLMLDSDRMTRAKPPTHHPVQVTFKSCARGGHNHVDQQTRHMITHGCASIGPVGDESTLLGSFSGALPSVQGCSQTARRMPSCGPIGAHRPPRLVCVSVRVGSAGFRLAGV